MTALWFSGGKDSMACLYLLRDRLHEVHVLFANTGRYFPEHLETVAKAREMCPLWHEIKTDRIGQWNRNGMPSDLVPIDWTDLGQSFSSRKTVMVQSYLGCCHENISGPVWMKTKELGCRTVIRGQRSEESHRSPVKDGHEHEGVKFSHPIEGWTTNEVLAYLREQMGELPDHYALEHSSMDCFDCTAFAAHSHDRAKYMKDRHPTLFREYMGGVTKLYEAMTSAIRPYDQIMGLYSK